MADSNEKLSQDELRAELEEKVSNVVNVLKTNQKEKISSTVTPQQAFDDMRDLSINSISENSEKVNIKTKNNIILKNLGWSEKEILDFIDYITK